MPTFTYGTTSIDYTVHPQPSKRDCTIAVDWQSGVSVVVPENINPEQIDMVLYKKAPWILRRLAELREIHPLPAHHEFISGEKLPYLGRQYRLKVHTDPAIEEVSLKFQHGRFVAVAPKVCDPAWRSEQLSQQFRDWVVEHGWVKVQHRIELFAPRLGVAPSKVLLKEQQSRWGSCTKSGVIHINWKILMAPMRIVDYVVVHELVHMRHPNHSSEFWTTLQSVMPDYHERKEWLRLQGPTLEL